MSRPHKILLGMLLGTVLGLLTHIFASDASWLEFVTNQIARPLGQLFLRLILMIVVPLIFSVLVLGIFELGDSKIVGRLGIKTMVYALLASFTSVVIGLSFVGFLQPGKGLQGFDFSSIGIDPKQLSQNLKFAEGSKTISQILLELIPTNPFGAAVRALDGEIIAFMVFTLILGVALVMVRGNQNDDPLVRSLETLRDVCMKIVDFAMALAPYGIAGLMFAVTANFGWGMLLLLGKYVCVVLAGLLFQQLVVYSLLLKYYTHRSPLAFLRDTREIMITAFSTASSNATLPTTIRITNEKLGVDQKVSSFVLTIGSAANQNGTALFEGVTILFLAQVFGIDLTLWQQLTVLLMSIVAGVGTAGVPGGSIPMIIVVMQAVGIPAEGIGLILGVDRLLDMARTVLNVTGDVVAACVIDHSEKKRAAKLAASNPSLASAAAVQIMHSQNDRL